MGNKITEVMIDIPCVESMAMTSRHKSEEGSIERFEMLQMLIVLKLDVRDRICIYAKACIRIRGANSRTLYRRRRVDILRWCIYSTVYGLTAG